jgi:hypothetical protein
MGIWVRAIAVAGITKKMRLGVASGSSFLEGKKGDVI